jgi:hypothetical protein
MGLECGCYKRSGFSGAPWRGYLVWLRHLHQAG